MPPLLEIHAAMTLVSADPAELAELGAPMAGTVAKKGRVHEFLQLLPDGKVGRRFQDLRVFAVKAVEGDVASAKVFVQFEVFGDNTAMPPDGGGFDMAFFAAGQPLDCGASGHLFLPYANFWYPNRFVFEVPLAHFGPMDRIEFIARPEEVRSVG